MLFRSEKVLERYNFGDAEYLKQCRPGAIAGVLRDFEFNENGRIIAFRGFTVGAGIVTNIAWVDAESTDVKMQYLIDELSEYFDKIVDITAEYRTEDK